MTPEELKREGKYSDDYQNELTGGLALTIVVVLVGLIIYGVAMAVMYYRGA